METVMGKDKGPTYFFNRPAQQNSSATKLLVAQMIVIEFVFSIAK